MDSKEISAHTVESLLVKNKALFEELSQCKADKDFVWNLWKRLQTAQPDLTSVISMVIAREKEKGENKDKKVLEILQLKDEKIKELQEVIESGHDEVKYSKERYHDLLIENEELKQRIEERKNEMSKKENELKEENIYLSDLVNAHQIQNENIEKRFKENTVAWEKEIEELKAHISTLESEVDKLSSSKSTLASVMEDNTKLQARTEELENALEEITGHSGSVVRQYEDAVATLKLREVQLQDQSKVIQEQAEQLEVKGQEVVALRHELSESKAMQEQFSQHVVEQDITIKQLQSLQDDTQKVIVAREEAHSNEIMLHKKLVNELQDKCASCEQARNEIEEDIERLKEINNRNEENIRIKEEVITQLKDAVRGEKNRRSPTPPRAKRLAADACENCRELRQRIFNLEAEHERVKANLQQKLRRISFLEKAMRSSLDRRNVEEQSSLALGVEQARTAVEQVRPGEDTEGLKEEWDQTRKKLAGAERRNQELKQLLDLKETELVEVKRAHGQRLQRYKLLQENHKLVLEQLKTFDNITGSQKEKHIPERPASKALRHENSEGVWNELAHYKTEYEQLAKERHEVLEELDLLRVQRADDQCVIQELKVCLEEEKEVSVLQRKLNKEEIEEVSNFVRIAELESQLNDWRDKEIRWQDTFDVLEEENKALKDELSSILAVNEELKIQITNQQSKLETERRRLDEQEEKVKRYKEELERAVAEIRSLNEPSQDKHQDQLSRSGSSEKKLLEQQVKSIDMYDKQVKRIAEKILDSPGQGRNSPLKFTQATQVNKSPKKSAQATQTEDQPSFSDFSVNVDMEASLSEDEENKDLNKSVRGTNRGDQSLTSRTPIRTKKVVSLSKKTPAKNEWSSMKQRVLSLTQQVAAIRKSKEAAVRAMNEQKEASDSLQAELNHVLQRLQVSKKSVQTLTEDLKKCVAEKETLLAEKREGKMAQQSQSEWKRLEERLKISANECSRLSYLVKSLRNENEKLKEELKESQERLLRAERAVNQKKTLVEEMRTKLRSAQNTDEREAEVKKDMENKIRRITGREIQMKMQVDTLKRQLDSESRDKRQLQQQFLLCQEELNKKVRLLAQSQSLRNQAEMVVNEMENAATMQLQGLANKSEATIKQLHSKLHSANERGEEFQAFIKTLADELLSDIHKTRLQLSHGEEQLRRQNEAKPAMRQARDTARSILNMTSSDLEYLLNEEELEADELEKKVRKEKGWMDKLDAALQRDSSFAVPLMEVLLDIVEEKVSLQTQLNSLVLEARAGR